jgi:hypothetical protein
MADREKFIKCDCHGEGILVTKYDDEEEMYFSYWREGMNPIKLSWWMRLKLCYLALFKGNFYNDQVILNKEKAMELALWIQEEHDAVPPMDKTKFAVGNLLDRKPPDPALEQDKTDEWGGV